MPIDLHVHSTASDGTCTPTQIVLLAINKSLSAIAITDHDSIGGIEEALFQSNENIEIVPGIEISCLFYDKDIHILGYFINHKLNLLNEELNRYSKIRIERAGKMAEMLQLMGLNITTDEIIQEALPAAPGRAHVARLLVKKGYLKSTSDAFEKYLKRGRPCYVPKKGASAKDSINLIKAAGGLTSLAHPGSSELSQSEIIELKELGIDAIEVFHPNHNKQTIASLLNLSAKLDLLITGGSDYHGTYRDSNSSLFRLNDKYLSALKAALC